MGSKWILGRLVEGVEWVYLAKDRDLWRAVVNAVMNLCVLAPRNWLVRSCLESANGYLELSSDGKESFCLLLLEMSHNQVCLDAVIAFPDDVFFPNYFKLYFKVSEPSKLYQ
jgi:hypothetical protein